MAPTLARRAGAPPSALERVERLVVPAIVAGCSLFVLLEIGPALLLRDTTPAGGDMGAHVWFPAFFGDHLLPHLRLAGWSWDFYAGFPAGQFYFPLPAVLVVILDVVLPYNVAFKLVSALGPVLLPIGAGVFLRGLRAPRPMAALGAVGATAFLFFKGSPRPTDAQSVAFNQHIMGGNLASTLAGEYSFGLALALALFFLGALAWTLERRRMFWLPALLGAAVVFSHLVVAVFAVVGALVVWLTGRPRRDFAPVLAIGVVAGLLTAMWTLPLVASLGYTTDMRYEPLTAYLTYLFPGYLAWTLPFVIAAIIGGIVEWRRATLVVAALTAISGLGFRFWEDVSATPVWNLRLLPFWYLGIFLLVALGAGEIVRAIGRLVARGVDEWQLADELHELDAGHDREPQRSDAPTRPGAGRADVARRVTIGVLAIVVTAGTFQRLHETRGFLAFWARWNYTGVEETGPPGAGKAYPEYRALLDAMAELPPGRAVWEPSADLDRYGTTLALMMLPYYTDGRISSLEGLYYESAATTPYAFLTVAKLAGAGNASNPVRGLEYLTIADFALGVTQLQELGVRYFLAQSDEAKEAAASEPRLDLVATVPDFDGRPPEGWARMSRGDGPLVESLPAEPVVVPGGASAAPPTVSPGAPADPTSPPVALDGPDRWARATDGAGPRVERLPPNRISDVETDERSLRFRVTEPGIPIAVNVEYSADWRAAGADGPWPLRDGGMVLVPTERDVALTFTAPPRGWEIYEVDGAELVSPLRFEPAVVEDLRSRPATECYAARGTFSARSEELGAWECLAAPWWDDAAALDVPLAESGPEAWQRVDDAADVERTRVPRVGVSDIRTDDDSLSFRVDRIGVPVIVKVSDYPNWQVDGGLGPWRVTPNFMVVVPTEEQVTLTFTTTAPEWWGRLLTLIGLAGLGLLVWWIPGRRPRVRARGASVPTGGPDSTGTMADSHPGPEAGS